MVNKKGKSGYLILLVIPAFIGFLVLLGKYLRNNLMEVDRLGKETTGILSSTAGEYLKIEYVANGKIYVKGEREPCAFLHDGEVYTVKFMPDDPENAVVYYDRPVFPEGVKFDLVDCSHLEKSFSFVDFKYLINGTEYRRMTPYKEGQSLNSNNYMVKYRIDNPKIGYLVLKE